MKNPFTSKKWLAGLIAILIVALGAGLVIMKKRELASLPKPAQRSIPVQVAVAKPGTVLVMRHYLGKAESMLTADITPRITANILVVHCREGDAVHTGDALVDLDDLTLANRLRGAEADVRSAQSALTAAESNYEAQKASFERDEYLYKNKALSQEAYERSRAATASAYSQVVAARERLRLLTENREAAAVERGYAHITAPFDGVVTKRSAEPGEVAIPGKPLLTLQAVNQGYKITVQVPQENAASIRTGDEVIISDGAQKMTATVYRVYPAVTVNNLATVEIRLPEMPFQLPPGASVGVDFVLNKAQGLVVPVQALLANSKGTFVVVVDKNNVVHQTKVEVVGRNDKEAAVTGIGPDTTVVVGQENILMQLMDGKLVTVIPAGRDGN